MMTRIAVVAALALAACHSHDHDIFGPPTQSVCPPTQTLTYANFGMTFMETYCTQCHHSALMGAARMGAPSFHDFDTVFGIRAVAPHIDEVAASGPAATNEGMPEDDPKPTLLERQQLGEWIACGAPE